MITISGYNEWVLNEKALFTVGQVFPVYVQDLKSAPKDAIQFYLSRDWKWARTIDKERERWNSGNSIYILYPDDQKIFGDYPMFFAQVQKEGIKWVECKVIFTNAAWASAYPQLIRFDKKQMTLEDLPLEYKYFQDLVYRDGDQKFIEKNSDQVFNSVGKKVDNPAGTYSLEGLNYELTYEKGEAYFNIREKSAKYDPEDCFSVTAEFWFSKQENLSDAELQIVAKECSKYIGATVEVEDGDFAIPWFTVEPKDGTSYTNPRFGIHAKPSFGPFFTREEGENHIEALIEQNKRKRLPFDPEDLHVKECADYIKYKLTLSQLIDYVKTFNVSIELEEFFQKHRGAITAKKFGFN